MRTCLLLDLDGVFGFLSLNEEEIYDGVLLNAQ